MNIIEKRINGVFEILLDPVIDQRGFFMRTYDIDIFKKFRLHYEWVQENHSRSEKKGSSGDYIFNFLHILKLNWLDVLEALYWMFLST